MKDARRWRGAGVTPDIVRDVIDGKIDIGYTLLPWEQKLLSLRFGLVDGWMHSWNDMEKMIPASGSMMSGTHRKRMRWREEELVKMIRETIGRNPNMKNPIHSYDVVAYSPPDSGYILCPECTPKSKKSVYHPVFADSEWDCYPTCDKCLRTIDEVNLTSCGRKYQKHLKDNTRRRGMKNPRHIGSQTRETLDEAGMYILHRLNKDEVLLKSLPNRRGIISRDKPELWVRNDQHSGYVIEINGIGYEFVRIVSNVKNVISNPLVTMQAVRDANKMWFSRGNKRFFHDVSYRILHSSSGRPYLVRSTHAWTDMFGNKPRLHWRLNIIKQDLDIGELTKDEFATLQDVKIWLREN